MKFKEYFEAVNRLYNKAEELEGQASGIAEDARALRSAIEDLPVDIEEVTDFPEPEAEVEEKTND